MLEGSAGALLKNSKKISFLLHMPVAN